MKFKHLKEMKQTFDVFETKLLCKVQIVTQNLNGRTKRYHSPSGPKESPLEIVILLKEVKGLKEFYRPNFHFKLLQFPHDVQKYFSKEKDKYLQKKSHEEIEKALRTTALLELGDDESEDPTICATGSEKAKSYFKSNSSKKELLQIAKDGFTVKGDCTFNEFCNFLDEHSRKTIIGYRETILENYATIAKATDIVTSVMSKFVNIALNAPITFDKEKETWEWDCSMCKHCIPFLLSNLKTGQGRREKINVFDETELKKDLSCLLQH